MTPEKALNTILSNTGPTPIMSCSVAEAGGRVLLASVRAPDHLPRFDNAAMDGFAVRAHDLRSASVKNPARLHILDEASAGLSTRKKVRSGTAIRISTGALLPSGADAVVMQEDCRIHKSHVEVFSSAATGENIRRKGEEICRGGIAIAKGEVLNAGSVAWLASMGVRQVRVHAAPRIGILRSGDEVVEWNSSPRLDQVRDTHGLFLKLQLERLGINPLLMPIVADDVRHIQKNFAILLRSSDVVMTTGGVSVGPHDKLVEIAKRNGMKILFSKVAQKPGGPFTTGVKDGKLWFGLPGNPFSVAVCYMLYVRPALMKMMHLPAPRPAWFAANTKHPLVPPRNKTVFLLGKDVRGKVLLNPQKGSHCLGAFANSNVLVRLEPKTSASKTRRVACFRLEEVPGNPIRLPLPAGRRSV